MYLIQGILPSLCLSLEMKQNNTIYKYSYLTFLSMGATQATMGIWCTAEQLRTWQCTFNANTALWIKQNQPDVSVDAFAEDIILSATFFIGTVVAIWLMYSGWIYIMAKDDAAAAKGKNGIKWSFIGVLLVIGSYTIIRLVQYIAKW